MSGFRLSSVLRVRRLQENSAHAASVRAQRDADAFARVAAHRAERAEAADFAGSSTGLALQSALVAARARAVEAALAAQVADSSARAAWAARESHTGAAQRVKALETLESHHRERTRHAEELTETSRVDDLVSGRYARARSRARDGASSSSSSSTSGAQS